MREREKERERVCERERACFCKTEGARENPPHTLSLSLSLSLSPSPSVGLIRRALSAYIRALLRPPYNAEIALLPEEYGLIWE